MSEPAVPRDPVEDLRRIAFLLERTLESSYRVKAFRTAAAALAALPPDDVALLATTGGLRGIKGIGDRTALVVEQSVGGAEPAYLRDLEASAAGPLADLSEGGEGCGPRCAATCTCTRTGPTAARRRRDGPHGGRARSRLPRAHRPLTPAHRRAAGSPRPGCASSSTSSAR